MSATLRVEDFTENRYLFPVEPPVAKVRSFRLYRLSGCIVTCALQMHCDDDEDDDDKICHFVVLMSHCNCLFC